MVDGRWKICERVWTFGFFERFVFSVRKPFYPPTTPTTPTTNNANNTNANNANNIGSLQASIIAFLVIIGLSWLMDGKKTTPSSVGEKSE